MSKTIWQNRLQRLDFVYQKTQQSLYLRESGQLNNNTSLVILSKRFVELLYSTGFK